MKSLILTKAAFIWSQNSNIVKYTIITIQNNSFLL